MNKTTIKNIWAFKKGSEQKLPFFLSTISAGFPSPADDYIDKRLDLNDLLIKHQNATYYVEVAGDSMKDAGINNGDILIVDKALNPKNNSVIIALLDGEFTVKRIMKKKEKTFLMPENNSYDPIEITNSDNFAVWGVVTYVVHKV